MAKFNIRMRALNIGTYNLYNIIDEKESTSEASWSWNCLSEIRAYCNYIYPKSMDSTIAVSESMWRRLLKNEALSATRAAPPYLCSVRRIWASREHYPDLSLK